MLNKWFEKLLLGLVVQKHYVQCLCYIQIICLIKSFSHTYFIKWSHIPNTFIWPSYLWESFPLNCLIVTPLITIVSRLSIIFPPSMYRKVHLDSQCISVSVENCVTKSSCCLGSFRWIAMSFKSSGKKKWCMMVSCLAEEPL